jgi:hypothetical protein
MNLKRISKLLLALLWTSTLATALVWILVDNPPFDPEPVTVVLGLMSTATTALLSEYASRLEQESFSPAFALAYGYVNNFVEPVLTQLIKQHKLDVLLYIYIPEKLAELEPRSIDRIMAHIRERNFNDEVVNLEFAEGRARDILSIRQSANNPVYFDFPNTLLTLNSFIDYKLNTARKPSHDARDLLGRQYIGKFRDTVKEITDAKGLSSHIRFISKDLIF